MTFRVGTQSIFSRAILGMRTSQFQLVRAQEQLSSGRRILRPSDDPAGSARVLSLSRQIGDVHRYREAIGAGLGVVNTVADEIQGAGELLSEARALLLQGMNGTLTPEDREAIASEFDLIRIQLLEIGNLKSGERYLFAGTASDRVPYQEISANGRTRIVYGGNGESQVVRVGLGVDVPLSLPGPEIFGSFESSGVELVGITGLGLGTTANEGSGYGYLRLRHDSTDPGLLAGAGVALVNGGGADTLLGGHALTIDPVAGTVQLGSGAAVPIPDPLSPGAADFVVTNEGGGELHLDFSGYAGASFAGTVTGNGSVSLEGGPFTAIDLAATDLELIDEASGIVVHVDATSLQREGTEMLSFRGAVNVFDTLQGIAEDLRNGDGLDHPDILARLDTRLNELQRNHENLLVGLGTVGSRSQRLTSAEQRTFDVELRLESLLSGTQDADISEVAIDLARSDLILRTAQASGARLIQTSLLNFLG